MTEQIFKPDTIDDIPFPGLSETGGDSSSKSGNQEIMTPDTIKSKEFPTQSIARNVIGMSFDSQKRRILGDFTFGESGAISIGKYKSGVSGDIRITPNGIIGRNSSGATTFAIDGVTGDASFLGTISATAGNIGGFTIQSSYLWAGSGSNIAGLSPSDYPFWAGASYANRASAPFRITPAGALYASSATITGALTTGIGSSINADYLKAGTIVVGGTDRPTALTIMESSLTGNARLGWEHGSRMWEDSASKLGLNSIGGEMFFYMNSDEVMFLGTGNINLYKKAYCKEIAMNIGSQEEGSISRLDRLVGYNDLWVVGNGDIKFPRDTSDNPGVRFEWGTGKIFSYSSSINLGGTDKTAIVPTSKGYRALYCAESPEVWLFDFCKSKSDIDPLFLEVTEGVSKFIRTGDGFQIWRKRKGHATKRFEEKSHLQFIKNEAFLRLAK